MDRLIIGDEVEAKNEAILMKECPKCNKIVRKSLRYGSQLKRILKDAVQIKKRVLGQKENKDILIEEIQSKCCARYYIGFVNDITELIAESLRRFQISRPEYHLLDNLATVTSKIDNIDEYVWVYCGNRQAICDRLEDIKGWVLEMVPRKDLQYGSEQQLKEVVRELNSITAHLSLLKIAERRNLNVQDKTAYETAISIVGSLQQFTRAKQISVETIQGVLGIKISKNIKIVKAVGMNSGQWFKCQNGHYYAITELEDDIVGGSCNECKAITDGGPSPSVDNHCYIPDIEPYPYGLESEEDW